MVYAAGQTYVLRCELDRARELFAVKGLDRTTFWTTYRYAHLRAFEGHVTEAAHGIPSLPARALDETMAAAIEPFLTQRDRWWLDSDSIGRVLAGCGW